jgi:hypothetical protein
MLCLSQAVLVPHAMMRETDCGSAYVLAVGRMLLVNALRLHWAAAAVVQLRRGHKDVPVPCHLDVPDVVGFAVPDGMPSEQKSNSISGVGGEWQHRLLRWRQERD